jgi:hypothetical protein
MAGLWSFFRRQPTEIAAEHVTDRLRDYDP